MKKILLINPANTHRGLGIKRTTTWPPLNLPYIASVTPKNYIIDIIDENIGEFEYAHADIVGITAYTSTVNRAYEIAGIYKKKGIPVVMGGIHVSLLPDEALKYCDSIVIGESEFLWPKLLQDFENGNLKKKYSGGYPDLRSLPLPDRSILHSDFYTWGTIQTSRGCPLDCAFCSVAAINGRRFRRRPIKSVVSELNSISNKYVMVVDDNLLGFGDEDVTWTKKFFSEIIDQRIKKNLFIQSSINFGEDISLIKLARKAGVRIVFIGIESINPNSLKSINKRLNYRSFKEKKYIKLISNIRRNGIAVLGAFILGTDNDDISTFINTHKFIKRSKIDALQLTKLTPLPGTKLWETLKEQNRLLKTNFPEDWDEYRLTKLVFKPKLISIDDVYKGFTEIRIKYYSLKETIIRTFLTLLHTKSISSTVLSYKINKSYKEAFIKSNHYKIYR